MCAWQTCNDVRQYLSQLNLVYYIATPGITAWHMQSLPFVKRLNYSTVANLAGVLTNVISAFLASMFFDSILENGLSISSLTPTLTAIIILRCFALAAALKQKPWLRMLSTALLGYSCAYMTNAFITPSTLYCYILCIVLGNLFQPCIDIVRGNIIYLNMPDANRTAYISLNAILLQVECLAGAYVGTLFVQYKEGLSVRLFGFDMCNLQLVNVIAAVLGVCNAAYTFVYSLKSVKE